MNVIIYREWHGLVLIFVFFWLSVLTTDKISDNVEEDSVELEEENVSIPATKIKPGSKYVRFKSYMLKTIITKKEADWETNQKRKENLFESREPLDEDSLGIINNFLKQFFERREKQIFRGQP